MKTLYRKRTFEEWKALPSEQQVAISRGRTLADYGYVADEQATRNARMGEAVYAAIEGAAHDMAVTVDVHVLGTTGMALRVILAIAAAWEPAVDAKEAGNE